MKVQEMDANVAEKLSSYLAYLEDENATCMSPEDLLNLWRKSGKFKKSVPFQQKNKYSFVQVKEGGPISSVLMNF